MMIQHDLLSFKTAAFQCAGGPYPREFQNALRARFLSTLMQYCFSRPILVDLILSRQWMNLSKACFQLLEPRLNAAPPDGASSSSGGPRSSIPTPIRNNIARVRLKGNDPNFNHVKADEAGRVYNVYKPVGSFSAELPLAEVKSLIYVSKAGPSWQTFAAAADSNQRPHILR
jgi:hypothetical protein